MTIFVVLFKVMPLPYSELFSIHTGNGDNHGSGYHPLIKLTCLEILVCFLSLEYTSFGISVLHVQYLYLHEGINILHQN